MLIVQRVVGLASVQDLGRPGRMHEAIPPGGALVSALLVAANRRAGAADDAPAIEVFGRATFRADDDLVTSEGELHAGDEVTIASEPQRVAYLALRGGVEAPSFLGGRGALVSIGMGPILHAGDRIAAATRYAAPSAPPALGDLAAPIHVVPGPEIAAFADPAALYAAPYRILPASDRVGSRLAGTALGLRDGYVAVSRPMICGAIEVPTDGQPIVLGREHPITGGYPLIGVIASADLDRFFATRLGGTVRFVIAK